MSINKEYFTVVVVGADFRPAKQIDSLVFALRDGEEYSLHLTNHHPTRRANAKIFIDGKEVVYVRVEKKSSITIERPYEVSSKFTFVKAVRDKSSQPNPDQGVLKIDFEMERPVQCVSSGVWETDGVDLCDGPEPAGYRGKTIFGRYSAQKFKEALPIVMDYITTVRAILVVDE